MLCYVQVTITFLIFRNELFLVEIAQLISTGAETMSA